MNVQYDSIYNFMGFKNSLQANEANKLIEIALEQNSSWPR